MRLLRQKLVSQNYNLAYNWMYSLCIEALVK